MQSHLQGCLVARGRYVLMADADGATRFSDLLKLENTIHNIQRDERGVVVGSRAQYHEEASESERVSPYIRSLLLIPPVLRRWDGNHQNDH